MNTEIENPSIEKKDKILQGRNWSFFAYPESMDKNLFVNLLNDSDNSKGTSTEHSVLISPCHDKDVDDFGNIKKAHYHIMLMYNSDKTIVAIDRYARLRGLLLPEKCNKKKMARYLCHLDEADKYLYNVDDVVAYNCNYLDIIGSASDKYDDMRQVIQLVHDNDFLFYCDLVDYCRENDDEKFRYLVSGGTYLIEKYIRERRAKMAFRENVINSMMK